MDTNLEARDFVGRCTDTIGQIDLMGYTIGLTEIQQMEHLGGVENALLRVTKEQIMELRRNLVTLRDGAAKVFPRE